MGWQDAAWVSASPAELPFQTVAVLQIGAPEAGLPTTLGSLGSVKLRASSRHVRSVLATEGGLAFSWELSFLDWASRLGYWPFLLQCLRGGSVAVGDHRVSLASYLVDVSHSRLVLRQVLSKWCLPLPSESCIVISGVLLHCSPLLRRNHCRTEIHNCFWGFQRL